MSLDALSRSMFRPQLRQAELELGCGWLLARDGTPCPDSIESNMNAAQDYRRDYSNLDGGGREGSNLPRKESKGRYASIEPPPSRALGEVGLEGAKKPFHLITNELRAWKFVSGRGQIADP